MGTRAILFFIGLFLVATLPTVDAGEKRCGVGDHLVPFHNERDEDGYLGAYRKCWQEKLLVTPGEVARFIYLPGLVGEETSLSIYRIRREKKANHYAVTATQASKRLWSFFTPGGNLPGRPEDVPITRGDAEIPESTALAVRALWMTALGDARKPPSSNVISLDSSTEIYSAVDEHGQLRTAKGPDVFGPKTKRLFEFTYSLMEYIDAKPARQKQQVEKIRKEADELRRAFERR